MNKPVNSFLHMLCIALAFAQLSLLLAPRAVAQQGPGVPSLSFTENELYTPLHAFPTSVIGARPTFAAMHRGYLIVAGGGVGNEPRALTFWDITDPTTPGLHSSTIDNTIFKTHAMGFSEDLMTVRAEGGVLYDVSNPAAPVRKGTMGGTASSLWTYYSHPYIYKGGEGYENASGWVSILDASDPDNITVVKELNMPALVGFRCGATHVLGNILVVSASQTNGVVTFDISDPVNPVLLDVLRVPGDNTYTSLMNGNRLYSGGQDGGLHVYDLSDPTNITHLGSVHPGGSPRYPMLQDEFIHLGNLGNDTYQKIDINRMQVAVSSTLPDGPLSDPEIALPMGNLVFVGNSVLDTTLPGGYLLAHDTEPDTKGMVLSAVRPTDGETNVASSSMIGIALSDQIDPTTVDSSSFFVRPVGGAAIAGRYTTQTGTINFVPDQPLSANTTYEVVVPANGVRDLSNNGVSVASITRFSTGSTLNQSPPSAPTSLGAIAVSNAQVDLTWSDTSSSETSFLVERKTEQGPFFPLAEIAANSSSYSDLDVTPFTQYIYRVRAQGDGNSIYSAQVSVTTPGAALGDSLLAHWPLDNDLTDLSGNPVTASLNGNAVFTADASVGAAAIALDGNADWLNTDGFTVGDAFSISMWAKIDANQSDIQTLVANTNGGSPADGFRLFVNEYQTSNGSLRFETQDNQTGAVAFSPLGTFAFDQWNHIALVVDKVAGVARIYYNGADVTSNPSMLQDFNTTGPWQFGNMINFFGLGGNIDDVRIYDRAITAFDIAQLTESAPPAAPSNLNASSPSASSVNLSWSDNSNNENTFLIERREGSGAFVQVATAFANATTYLDNNLSAGTTYSYRIRSANHIGESTYSNVASATTSAGNAAPGLTAHWELDASAFDSTANANDGILFGGAGFNADSAIGSHALALNGFNQYMSAGNFNLSEQFTIALWAKLEPGSSNIQTLAANGVGGFTPTGFRLFINSYETSDGRILLETGNDLAGDLALSPVGIFTAGQWNHVAIVVDRSVGLARIYYNGVDVTVDFTTMPDFNPNAIIHFGEMRGSGFHFNGSLDDIRIYDRALSAAEVSGLANPGDGGTLATTLGTQPAITTGSAITLSPNSVSGGDGVLEYSWDLNDGTPATAFVTNPEITHSFASPGHYTVRLTVRDQQGQQSSAVYLQTVHNALTAGQPRASSSIIYDTANDTVWNVNPDNDTVTKINGIALTKLGEYAVGDNPRTLALDGSGNLWVANQNDASITVLNAASGAIVETIPLPYGSAPYGISFNPALSKAYVTLEGSGELIELDAVSRVIQRSLNIGPTPRGIAVTHDNATLLVTRFISPDSGGEVIEIDANTFTVASVIALVNDPGPDTPSSSRGIPNYLPSLTISPDGERAWVPSKKDNIDRGLFNDGQLMTFESTVRTIASKINLGSASEELAERIDFDNSSLASAVQFSPLGDWAFVALTGNNLIDVRDAYSGSSVAGLVTELAPQGLALSADGSRLFTHDYMSRNVSVFDTSNFNNGVGASANAIASVATVANEALAQDVLTGKQIFYNAADLKMSMDGYISCASCHIEGGEDGRVWDFTDRGEGLRNTIDMRGRSGLGHGNVHWTASFDEIQDFENDIRSAFSGQGFLSAAQFAATEDPLGSPKAGLSTELDALSAYISSLAELPNSPHRLNSGELSATANAGREHFLALGCASCHTGPRFTDSLRHDVGTIQSSSGQGIGQALAGVGFETPTLKGLWASGPYLHNGQAGSIEAALLVPGHDLASSLDAQQRSDLVDYLLQIDNDGGDFPENCDFYAFPGDSDCDGLLDTAETNTGVFQSASDTGSNPLLADSDEDGVSDGDEVSAGSNPNIADLMIPAVSVFGLLLLASALVFARSRRAR